MELPYLARTPSMVYSNSSKRTELRPILRQSQFVSCCRNLGLVSLPNPQAQVVHGPDCTTFGSKSEWTTSALRNRHEPRQLPSASHGKSPK